MSPTPQSNATGPATDDELLRLEAQLCFPVTVAARLLVKAYRHALAPLQLTHPQYLVMLALWQHDQEHPSQPPYSAKDLAAALSLEPPTLTGLLQRLEKQGLVTRARASQDDRRREITLTDAGRALRERAKTVPREMAGKMSLNTQELTEITDSARRLIAALDAQ